MDYDLKTVTVWFPFEIILFLLKYQKPPEKKNDFNAHILKIKWIGNKLKFLEIIYMHNPPLMSKEVIFKYLKFLLF